MTLVDGHVFSATMVRTVKYVVDCVKVVLLTISSASMSKNDARLL